jgi:thioredoxin reductase (NADPH)
MTPPDATPTVEEIDVAIIGGGPTGLSAAIYSSRGLRRTVVWESLMIGGQIAQAGAIENYPGFPEPIDGFDLATAMHTQAENFGVETKYESVGALRREGRYYILEADSGVYRARAVIVTAGATPNVLGVPGEQELTGKGVSYCATCDAAFFKDREVAVVGGGNAALDEALFTTRFVSKVTIIHRRDELRAARILQQRAFDDPKVEMLWDSVVEGVNGDDAVTSLALKNTRTGERSELEAEALFVFVGSTPNSNLLAGLVPLDVGGHAYVNLWMESELPGLFAAGDVRVDASKQVVSAAGDGATAAIRADHYITQRFPEEQDSSRI